jgi:hypothetical protein
MLRFRVIFEHLAALTAFAAWALILPLSPVTSWCDWQPQYGVAAGVVVLLLLGVTSQIVRLLGKKTPMRWDFVTSGA